MIKILFIQKKNPGFVWSSAIDDLFDWGKRKLEQVDLESCIITTKGNNTEVKNKISSLKKDDIIVFNHAISFWLLQKSIRKAKKTGVKIFYFMHEHEHILGQYFLINNLINIKPKEWLRYCYFWYKKPIKFSTNIIGLSFCQCINTIILKKFWRISALGIKPEIFPAKGNVSTAPNKKIKILFAHNPSRFDKGFRFTNFIKENDELELIMGNNLKLPYNEVYTKYHNADIVFLPSDYESYSIVLIEALATNSLIVTNTNAGVIQLLLSKYSKLELEDKGLFISEHNINKYRETMSKAIKAIKNNKTVSTSELFKEFHFDLDTCSRHFWDELLSN